MGIMTTWSMPPSVVSLQGPTSYSAWTQLGTAGTEPPFKLARKHICTATTSVMDTPKICRFSTKQVTNTILMFWRFPYKCWVSFKVCTQGCLCYFQATHTPGVRPQTVFGVRGVLPLPVVFHAVVECGRVVGPLKDKHIMVGKSVKEGTPRRRVATNGNVRICCFKSNFGNYGQLLFKYFDQDRCSCPQGHIVKIYVYRNHM